MGRDLRRRRRRMGVWYRVTESAQELIARSTENGTVMKHKPTWNTSRLVRLMDDLVIIRSPSLNLFREAPAKCITRFGCLFLES